MHQVQEAVRTTVLGLLGSLPRHAFETTAIATGDALANLMFQLQMTGYMFKNAEYRLSLQSSMKTAGALPPGKYRRLVDYACSCLHEIGNHLWMPVPDVCKYQVLCAAY